MIEHSKSLNFVLFIFILIILFANVIYACLEGMISYWRFDEGNGTFVSDFLGRNNGTMNTANWADGIIGKALNSPSLGSVYTQVPNSPSLNITGNQFTVEGWVYPVGPYGVAAWNVGMIGVKEITPGIGQYGIFLAGWDQRIFSVVRTTAGDKVTPSDINWTPYAWNYVVGTYNGTHLSIYVNGVLRGSEPWSGDIVSGEGPFWMNKYCNGYNWCLRGKIDEVAVYNRSLTQEEILLHYQAVLNGFGYCEIVQSNTVIDGLVFSNAKVVILTNAQNVTIKNSKFINASILLNGSNYNITIQNVTFENITDRPAIQINPGSYNIIIDKVNIRNVTGTNVDGIYLNGAQNVTINNSNVSLVARFGIYLYSSSYNQIINSSGSGNVGIYLYSSSYNQIINSSGSGSTGISLNYLSNNNQIINSSGSGNVGITLASSSYNQIINSSGSGYYYGIYLAYSSNNNQIINSSGSGSAQGIYLAYSSNNNQIINSSGSGKGGIYLYYSSNNNQIINSNSSGGDAGIDLYSSSNNSIINSIVSGNNFGIYLYNSLSNNVINSTVKNNGYGIYIISSSNNTLTSNILQNLVYDIYITEDSSNNLIYLNIILKGIEDKNGTNIYTFNGNGNFYGEGVTPLPVDEGPANITSLDLNGSLLSFTLKPQSSPLTVYYDIFIFNTTNTWRISNTTNLNYQIDLRNLRLISGNYTLKVVPFVLGSRINATNIFFNFTYSAPPSRPSPSRNHPPVIIDYNPKNLYIKTNLSEKINEIVINFYVKAQDEDNDNLIFEFFVNDISKKTCIGKGIVECSFLFATNKEGSYNIKGIVNDEKLESASIEWRLNVFNVTVVTKPCIDEWNCSEWSECIDGWRYRTCYKLNPECKSDLHKPEEKIPCEEVKPEEKPYEKEKLSPTLWLFIIVVTIIAVLLIFLFLLRLRKKEHEARIRKK